ncbi:universal stress protein [Halorubellus sp. PRR65]|uniref:universal stress protein n=1 Tax=Halorubellus sp. PRR65 TaxID=3098148 RepID=UPI002B25A399|nr:universal stress protein [Halorubellus sp. PRR65]
MRFLIAIDGSAAGDRAIEYAASLVDAARDHVTLVHVVNPDVYAGTASQPLSDLGEADDLLVSTVRDAEDRGARVLEESSADAAELGLSVDTELLYGNPASEVASYAADVEADGVFVGTTGKSERAERVLGSVAKNLVERASCPVTVVR